MEPNQERREALTKRLAEHPELFAQVEAMLAEVQDEKRSLQTGDDAEDAVVARIRTMGRVALEEWMRRRSAQLNATAPAKARAEGKKNSAG
jgi:peptidoglycan hydrolase CwlO-like protein